MEREGVREEIARLKEEKKNRTSERLKRLLKAGKLKKKPKPRAGEKDFTDITNMSTETQYASYNGPTLSRIDQNQELKRKI